MEALIILALVVVAILGSIAWSMSRSEQLLEQWVRANDFKLVSSRYCWIWRGPFFLTSTKCQSVYRVRVQLCDGRERSGWVRCGGFWAGLFSSKTTVSWDN